MEEHLNILVQSSDYYAPIAGVMLTSLFENNANISHITVYLITSDMTEENCTRFFSLVEKYKREIKFLEADKLDDLLQKQGAPKYKGSYTVYYKIFALSQIDDNIDRLIYLDSDMIVNGSLSYLANVDLEDNVIGMSLDGMLDKYKQMIKLDSSDYYNTGMIVFNVKKWTSGKWMKKIIDHMTFMHASYPLVEQDIVNLVLSGKIKTLPLTYNFNSGILWYKDYHFFLKSYGLKSYYSESEFLVTQQNPIVLHCMGTFGSRPWYEGDHSAKKVWNKYSKISPWNDCDFPQKAVSFTDKVQRLLFKYTPNCFFALIHKIFWEILWRKQIKDSNV